MAPVISFTGNYPSGYLQYSGMADV